MSFSCIVYAGLVRNSAAILGHSLVLLMISGKQLLFFRCGVLSLALMLTIIFVVKQNKWNQNIRVSLQAADDAPSSTELWADDQNFGPLSTSLLNDKAQSNDWIKTSNHFAKKNTNQIRSTISSILHTARRPAGKTKQPHVSQLKSESLHKRVSDIPDDILEVFSSVPCLRSIQR